ncbi:MAG: GNAT family N-acetyltransferase [Anaerolineae bacterium]|nr:GNAT family N-acetyltransferase [Anaerolineae bacterium]
MSIYEQRTQVRRLLDDSNPADAPTAYYALFHPPARSTLHVLTGETGQVDGFAGCFQTGIDLFRPLVTLACQDAACAADALAATLTPGRPYILFANMNQLPLVGGSLQINNHRVLQIYQLDSRRFEPVVNVLVQCKITDDVPRCWIDSGGLQAVSGVNWQSPAFAEIYVQTDTQARERGWGQSVTSSVVQAVLESGRIPLYLVENDNVPSRRLAENLGFVDTGARQVYADVVYLGHPAG